MFAPNAYRPFGRRGYDTDSGCEVRPTSSPGGYLSADRSCRSREKRLQVPSSPSSVPVLVVLFQNYAATRDTKVYSCGIADCSRAFIRAAYEDDTLPVPSPTYLLQNIYDELEGVREIRVKAESLHIPVESAWGLS